MRFYTYKTNYSSFRFFPLVLVMFFVSCNTDKVNPAIVIEEEELQNTTNEDIIYEGKFKDGAHPTSGTAQVLKGANNTLSLQFIDFKTDAGPDLRVYLAEDNNAKDFKEISKEVKNGSVRYNLPMGTDPESMDHVLIWCKAFSVNFGSAVLEKK